MLVFIDESGIPHPNDSTTRPVLVGMCLAEGDHRRLNQALFRYKRDLLGSEKPIDIKGTRFLRPRVLHKQPRKWELTQRIFDLIANTNLCVFAVIMERPTRKPFIELGTLPYQYRRLLERINVYVHQFGRENEMAVLVFDGEGMGGIPGGLAIAISNYLFRHPRGQALTHIFDTPLFVDSKITPGVQLVDMIASCIRQYEENELFRRSCGDDPFLSALDRFYRIVQRKAIDLETPIRPLYALFRMPERYFYLKEEEAADEEEEEE